MKIESKSYKMNSKNSLSSFLNFFTKHLYLLNYCQQNIFSLGISIKKKKNTILPSLLTCEISLCVNSSFLLFALK